MNPPDAGVLIFRTEDKAIVEEFARKDPYAVQGLVINSDIREWTVVIGTAKPTL